MAIGHGLSHGYDQVIVLMIFIVIVMMNFTVLAIVMFMVVVKSMNQLTNRSHGDQRPPETQWD